MTIQAQILALLKELVEETGTALIMITHDLGVVAGLCDEVNVLYARPDRRARRAPPAVRHARATRTPYGLLQSIPRLDAPRGEKLDADPGLGRRQPAVGLGLRVRAALLPRRSTRCTRDHPALEIEHGGRRLRCHNPVEVQQ